jgi:hypothetical protein
MTDTPEVAAARIEAARSRARLLDSVRALEAPVLDLKNQLTPSHIMGDAWDAAKSKGADLVEDAVDAVRSRPVTATSVVAAITMFLAREPLLDLAGKLVGGTGNKKQKAATAKKAASKDKTEKSE